MEKLKDAQNLVRNETAKLQAELAECVWGRLLSRGGEESRTGPHRVLTPCRRGREQLIQCTPCRMEFEGFSEDETIRVVVYGNQRPKAVDITDEAYGAGPEVCEMRGGLRDQAGTPFVHVAVARYDGRGRAQGWAWSSCQGSAFSLG